MAQLRKRLADYLNALAKDSRVAISETKDSLSVYQLTGGEAAAIVELLAPVEWRSIEASDQGGHLPLDGLAQQADGIQVTAQRVPLPPGVEAVLTEQGLERLLSRAPTTDYVWVQGLNTVVDTETVRYAPWGTSDAFVSKPDLIDPAKVVRFLSAPDSNRGHLGRFLLRHPEQPVHVEAMRAWKLNASKRLLTALAQEVEPEGQLLLRGPPPTRFSLDLPSDIPAKDFAALQSAARWVFENEREAENRHALLSSEIARTALRSGNLSDMAGGLSLSLEGAKIAYGFGLSQQSKDTLRALSDLRKAITDETSKLSDSTRTLCAAVVGAVFGNIGLLIARTTIPANGEYVAAAAFFLGIVLALYVVAVICSGVQYISIQRQLRAQWRQKLYRFLSNDEYAAMVEVPVKRAEKAFYVVSVIGATMAALCLCAVYEIVRA